LTPTFSTFLALSTAKVLLHPSAVTPPHCRCLLVSDLQEELHTQQAFYWQHYLANRIKEAAEQGQGVALEAATVAAGPGSQVTSAAAAAAAVAVGAAGGITKQQQQQQ
jgi:hypothetical protein